MNVFYSLNVLKFRLFSFKSCIFTLSARPKHFQRRHCSSVLSHGGKVVSVLHPADVARPSPSGYFDEDRKLLLQNRFILTDLCNRSYKDYRHFLSFNHHVIRPRRNQLNTEPTKEKGYTTITTSSSRFYSTFSSRNQSQYFVRPVLQCQSCQNCFQSPIIYTQLSTNNTRELQTKAKKVTRKVEKKVKEWQENIMTVPNLLTTSRIVLSPVLGYLILNEYYLLSCGLFIFTGITDMLDGYIARNFKNQQSVLGSILDPLADKFLVGILMVTLCMQGLIPGTNMPRLCPGPHREGGSQLPLDVVSRIVSLTALIIGRDVGLVSAGFYYRFKSLPPPFTLQRFFDVRHATVQMQPTFLGKFHTAVTLALLGFTLGAPVFNYLDHFYLQMLRYTTAATTIASGLSYVFTKDTVKFLRKIR